MAFPDLFSEIDFDDKETDSLDMSKVIRNPRDIVEEILEYQEVSQKQYNDLLDYYEVFGLQYTPKDRDVLKKLIDIFTEFNKGSKLNWIDVHNVTDMRSLFMHSYFSKH